MQHLAVGIDDLRNHPEERPRGRARLELGRPGQRRDQDAAGLGLPPGVDDRATAVADDPVVPFPGLRVDRLADRAEKAQRGARGLLHRRVAGLHQGADRGRRRVDDVDLVLVDHFPEPRHAGVVRHALEHQGRRRRSPAGRRRCSCARSPSRRRRCTSRCRRRDSRTRTGASSRCRPDSRRWYATRPSAFRSIPTCKG